MTQQAAGNYLKALRKKSGLTQQEIAKLLGYTNIGEISRHERSACVPLLAAALAYELIFRSPVATIFGGMRDAIARNVEEKLRELESGLEKHSADDRDANLIAQKLVWLNERKTRE